ncbi:MAG: M20 family metallopeptidase [Synechococcus sp.]
MTTSTAERLLQYLRSHQEEMENLLEKLVLAESPSTIPAAQQAVQSILRAELVGRGFRVRHLSGRHTGGHLLAVPRDRQPKQAFQLLLGHCDTVWPLGTLQTMPLVPAQGKLYGPGVYDMKAGLVMAIFATEAAREIAEIQSADIPVKPVLFVNSDEEIGSRESTPHIRRLARIADRAFVMEPSLGPNGKLKTGRKGVGKFSIRILGRAAHAGLDPEKGASAILELSHIIQQLFALNDPSRGITVNVGTIDGGIRPNVIAPESIAEVDVRILHQEDVPYIETAIRGLQPTTPGTRLEVNGRIGRPPMEHTPGNRLLWERAQIAASELGLEIDEATAGGGSDGNTTSLYTPTLDGLGAVGDSAHAVGECIVREHLSERTALLARLLLEPPLRSGH